MSQYTPEKMILTRLFGAQRRLRYVRGLAASLRWFAAGSVLAALGLLVLWNWDRLPGPWQWLASAGRPRELLWLPVLLALGGFASRWLNLPAMRETAYKVDCLRENQERLLTAVDWILSEKPRTGASQRLLEQAAAELEDEQKLRHDLARLDRVPPRTYALLLSITIPLALLLLLPPHVGLPDTAAVWLGANQVDRLTEALIEELEQAQSLEKPEEKLKELLKNLEQSGSPTETDKTKQAKAQRELQRTVDQMKQLAKGQESARQLLETLAQRARQGQDLSKEDKLALEELKQMMGQPEQKQALDKAESDWEKGDKEGAAEQLESMQQQAGQSAQELKEMAAEGQAQCDACQAPAAGKEFNEGQGDQHEGQGQGQGQSGKPKQQGQGQGQGAGGQDGEGQLPGDFGQGSTEEEQQGKGAAGNQRQRQSDRTSEKTEEFKNLHAPVRVEIETSQTKVKGAMGADGPRYRVEKEGRGAVTEPADIDSGGAVLEYRESAENALLREEIPADYRDEVRQYFEALDK
jgi:hypothetical protein